MKNISKILNLALVLLILGSVQSCVDTDFDEPVGKLTIPDDKVVSIATLMEHLPGTGSVLLSEDLLGTDELYVRGIVTSDDEAGNFFKTLYFQDETGGLLIEPDQNELNAAYPRGSIVYIRLLNLYLMRDSNVPKLAFALDGNRSVRIPDAIVSSIVLSGGRTDEVVVPEEVTLSQVAANSSLYFNKLLVIKDVEFTTDYLGGTYAIADGVDGPETVNTMIKDCGNTEMILRNSGYSNFAEHIVPGGNGSITCLLNKFSDDLQLFIRDTNDLQFSGDRCDGSSGTVEFPENELDLSTIKRDFLEQGVDKIPEGFITGIVISDKDQQNITNRNLILQSETSGIILRFASAHDYSLGDELKVNVSGQSFSEFNGGTQIDNISPLLVEVSGNGTLPEPILTTIGEINSNPYQFESRRVRVEGATISGPVYNFNITFSDATGSIVSFIQSFASFNGQATPTGNVDIVGYGSYYNEPQLLINGPSDITGGGSGTGGGDESVSQNFDGQADFTPVNYEGWMNVTALGNEPWYFRTFDDNGFAECEAYQSEDAEIESWLITPAIDTDEKSIISFQTAQAFWQHQGLSVWVSPDFDDFTEANWVELSDARIANEDDAQYTFIDSGDIELKNYGSGMMRVGWKYEGTSAANTTKMRIDNVILK